ncbi:uncharacterized protein LOC6535316 [Drosophila yakuba]|uniref:MD-2-related lipid-recognition domain-containing protein n=1 Tax=Drosophila yakuba TaxID=7245 RepID=B4PUG2_DROYA|nr:uncharacterized protein LOC6535316 [Drosophila yakuba]EDW95684.1 uncharacterized protein Dyak_GE25340 [Drosophila yakuba]
MGTVSNVLYLVLYFRIALEIGSINASRFKFTNFICDSVNESWLSVHQCRLKAIRRDTTTLSFNGTVLKTVSKLRVHAQIFKRANGFKPWLYNITFDGCRFLRKPYEAPVVLVFNLFKSFSNFNFTCPYMGPVHIMGFHLMGEQIPVPLPTGEYLIQIKWYIGKVLFLSTGIYFAFEENLSSYK